MKIVTVPHEALRKQAETVTTVDTNLVRFIGQLEKTLRKKNNPRGVGLAAPQVATNLAIFTTLLEVSRNKEQQRVFINPTIIDASDELVLGPNDDETSLEGCLSIPGIYGPVPRHSWATFRYDLVKGSELVSHTETFTDFSARVMQHELDHLHGILFTDHILKHKLPVYREHPKTKKLEEISLDALELL